MSQIERLEFFRRALGLCVKWRRSPQVALLGGGGKSIALPLAVATHPEARSYPCAPA